MIPLKSNDPVIAFAAKELEDALSRMGVGADAYSFSLGLFSELSLPFTGKDPLLDDEIAIRIQDGQGYLAGSNPRSVLFAVYRYLEACGVSYLRPGRNGTRYPRRTAPADLLLSEAAATRHRSICIEGAVSLENVLDMVDWMPKRGFNSYFIQFRDAFVFFDRWYSHRGNPLREPEGFTHERAEEYVKLIRREIKKRGLFLEVMGHGWTCEPFGVANDGWDKTDVSQIPKEYLAVCAQVNGVRKVWNDSPLATQVCLSNPAVRRTMNESVLQYLRENPETDILHYWMGDYFNNVCECEECSKLRVTDHYVMLLNELDALLTENGLNTRIVFENYYDFSTPPLRERIKNPGRFIMLFAPITRTYSESYPDHFPIKEIPPYVPNHYKFPITSAENLAHLYAWRQVYSGDAIDFDYHLMWDHLLDGSGENMARILYQDIRNFKALSLDGMSSCQLQRNFFPTSLAMTVMGKTLWNPELRFEDLRDELYAACFGDEACAQLEEYFAVLSDAFDIGAMRCQKPRGREEWKQAILRAIAKMDEIEPILKQGSQSEDPVTARSYELLLLHRGAYRPILFHLICLIEKKQEEARAQLEDAIRFAWKHEDALQEMLDCHFFADVLRERIEIDRRTLFGQEV